jgi:hypothetical protein
MMPITTYLAKPCASSGYIGQRLGRGCRTRTIDDQIGSLTEQGKRVATFNISKAIVNRPVFHRPSS